MLRMDVLSVNGIQPTLLRWKTRVVLIIKRRKSSNLQIKFTPKKSVMTSVFLKVMSAKNLSLERVQQIKVNVIYSEVDVCVLLIQLGILIRHLPK